MNYKHYIFLTLFVVATINGLCICFLPMEIWKWDIVVLDVTTYVIIGCVIKMQKYYKDCVRDETLSKIEFEGNNSQMAYCMYCKTFTMQYITFNEPSFSKHKNFYWRCDECEHVLEYITKTNS